MKDVGGLNVWALPSQPNAAIELALRQLSERSGADRRLAGTELSERGGDPEYIHDPREGGGRLQRAVFEPTRSRVEHGNKGQRHVIPRQNVVCDDRGLEGAASDGGSEREGIPGPLRLAVAPSGPAGRPGRDGYKFRQRARPQSLNRAGDVSYATAVWQRQDGVRNDAWTVAQWALALGYLLAVIDLKFLNWI